MIRLFARLKVRMLRNALSSSAGFSLAVFSIVSAMVSVTVTIGVLNTSAGTQRWLAPALTALLAIGWVFGPLLFGSADETIDTTRLALYPLRGRELAPGMAVANLIGPGPIAAAVPLLAFAIKQNGDFTGFWFPRFVLIVVAAATSLAFSVVASRLLLTQLGAALRRRNRRDLATLIAGLSAGVIGIGSQVVIYLGFDKGTISTLGQVGRWIPGGWTGEAIGRLVVGKSIWPPILLILLTAALTAVMAIWWTEVLDRALTEVSEGGEAESIGSHMLNDRQPWWVAVVPGRWLASAEMLRLVIAKEFRYLRRHPRYRIQVLTQFIVLVLGGAPFISGLLDREPIAVLVGCVPALTAGITSSNLFGADGRALWAEVLALPSLKPLLQGRSLAFAVLGMGAATAVTLGAAAWTGGWKFVPIALGAAIGMALTGAAVGALTSTLAPVNFPEDNNPNPFATEDTGQGCVNALITFSGVLIGLLLAGPILGGLALARTSSFAGVIVVVAAPLYGLLLFLGLTALAARRADRRAPELVAILT